MAANGIQYRCERTTWAGHFQPSKAEDACKAVFVFSLLCLLMYIHEMNENKQGWMMYVSQ